MSGSEASSLILPPDYRAIFDRRFCIITGVGRSGTTILGKLIGSMASAVYLFEPLILRLMPYLVERADLRLRPAMSKLMLSILFEDYFANVFNGRSLNFNEKDDSFYGNFMSRADLEARWHGRVRRQDLKKALDANPTLFVAKIPEFQLLFEPAAAIFPEPKYIQITRNGFDVVASATRLGWYDDRYLQTAFLDWMDEGPDGSLVPWFVDESSRAHFRRWTPATRAASVWRRLTEAGMAYIAAHPDRCRQLRYEDLTKDPEAVTADVGSWLGLAATEVTRRHLSAIEKFSPTQNDMDPRGIEEPERSLFMGLMDKLGYC